MSKFDTLPLGWAKTTLDAIRLDFSKSIDPRKTPREKFELYSVPSHCSGIPEYAYGNAIGSNKISVDTGTVLLCKINPRINRVWIVGSYSGHQKIASTEWIPFFIIGGIESKFLCYYLKQNVVRDYLAGNVSGVGGSLMRIRPSVLKGYPFPLPPTKEQRRIVEELEKYLSRLDEAVAGLKRAQANLKRYKASVLKAAVEGKLTEEWRKKNPDIEPAQKLLGRFGNKEPTQFVLAEDEELPQIPETWCWARLSSISEIKGGIAKDSKKKGEGRRRVPYLRVANVQRGYLDLDEVKEIEATEDKIDDLKLEWGDVLFNEGGDRDKLGRGWVWQDELPECIHQNHVFRARLLSLEDFSPKFVSWHGNTFGKDYFMREGKQTTNLASINITKLSNFPVPVPPADEQKVIVSLVDESLTLIDSLESSINTSLKRSVRLRQSILQKAFSGQLVPQYSNDEPASELLARIRKGSI